MSRRALEQNHSDFIDERQGGAQCDDGEEHRADGVDNLPVWLPPQHRAGDGHSDALDQVSQHVQVGGLEVHVVAVVVVAPMYCAVVVVGVRVSGVSVAVIVSSPTLGSASFDVSICVIVICVAAVIVSVSVAVTVVVTVCAASNPSLLRIAVTALVMPMTSALGTFRKSKWLDLS